MYRKTLALAVAVALALGLAACSPSAKSLTAGPDDKGRTLELANGGELTVELAGNPTTGYSWVADPASLGGVLEAAGEPEFTADSNAIGAGGTIRTRFKAIAAGTTTLKMGYRRSWETTVPPIETYEVTVDVK